MISSQQFFNAVTRNGFPRPSQAQYNGFIRAVDYAGINSRREAAMFLAQLIHESGGLQFKEELAYKNAYSDPYTSHLDRPGKRYYGRGYIQLTWAENYLKASRAIFGDDTLLNDPDKVARDEDIAFITAGWYWKTRVGNIRGVKEGRFGESTRAINGAVECNGQNVDKSRQRFRYYCTVFDEFDCPGSPNECGCYN
ncbi:unnamed protein product [Nezara viridula]|uniref:Glycoside hydrolase family 19 catalytic domain-containing protein n=1 Tax=Nezara viridula TaxID=85310 RepID=A0A9P0MTJ4_NEZVI|nr:unnamed protein product [Nezara viridula]